MTFSFNIRFLILLNNGTNNALIAIEIGIVIASINRRMRTGYFARYANPTKSVA